MAKEAVLLDPPKPAAPVVPMARADGPVVRLTTTVTLKWLQLFPAPIPMGEALNSVIVLPTVSFSGNTLTQLSAQVTQAVLVGMVNALKSGFTAATLTLFTNNFVPSQLTAWADLVEPTGSWYSQKTTTLGSARLLSDGTIGLSGSSAEWDYTGSSAAQNIMGWALIDLVTG